MTFKIVGRNNVGHTVVDKDEQFFAAFKSEEDAQSYVTLRNKWPHKRQTLDEMEAEDPNVFKNPE